MSLAGVMALLASRAARMHWINMSSAVVQDAAALCHRLTHDKTWECKLWMKVPRGCDRGFLHPITEVGKGQRYLSPLTAFPAAGRSFAGSPGPGTAGPVPAMRCRTAMSFFSVLLSPFNRVCAHSDGNKPTFVKVAQIRNGAVTSTSNCNEFFLGYHRRLKGQEAGPG